MSTSFRRARPRRVGGVLACAVIGWAASGATLLLAARSSAGALTTPGLAGLDALLATAASLLGLALLSWLAAGFAAAVLELSRAGMGGGVPHRLLGGKALAGRVHPPQAVRRLAAFALGLSLVTGTAGPVSAAATSAGTAITAPVVVDPGPAATTSSSHDGEEDGAGQPVGTPATEGAPATATEGAPATWTPDRPAPTVLRRALPDIGLVSAAPRLGAHASDQIAVRRGDTLWSIAARQLGPDAHADEVARRWPLWWQANKEVIGEDPDLIYPGQVLVAPTGAPG